jgi:hypothetical protein
LNDGVQPSRFFRDERAGHFGHEGFDCKSHWLLSLSEFYLLVKGRKSLTFDL